MKRTLLLVSFMLISVAAFAQTALSGKVVDADNGDDPLPFASVALKNGTTIVQGVNTDIDGNYFFSNIDPGTYDLEVSFTGFTTQRQEGVQVLAGKTTVVDIKLSSGVVLDVVEVKAYNVPLVEQDNTTQGRTVTSAEIRNLPTRNINAIAATAAGLSTADEGGALNIRGSRSNATDYYVDGIRVQGNLIPESEIEQLQVITGGIESRYGDVSGGVISITTKGPSSSFSGGLEVETSEPFNDYGQNLLGFNANGPILKRGDQSILGFRFSGRYTQRTDDDPSAVPIFRINDDKLAELEANPLIVLNNQQSGTPNVFNAGEFLTNDDVTSLSARPFEESLRLDLNGKLDARISDAIDVTLSGFYSDSENQFTPSENGGGSWRLLNAQRNPTNFRTDYRVNFRFRHRLGQQGAGTETSRGAIQNASYTLQVGYENNRNDLADPIHGDNYFDYGYVGNFDIDYIPVFDSIRNLDINSPLFGQIVDVEHAAYRSVLRSYDDSNSTNPILSNFNNVLPGFSPLIDNFDEVFNADQFAFLGRGTTSVGIDDFLSLNGSQLSNRNNIFGHHTNVGTVYNLVTKGDNDIFSFNATASFQIVPSSSDKSRHTIDMGIMYEQRTNRAWSLNPRSLWNLGRSSINEHITGVDTNLVVGSLTIATDTGMVNTPVYGNIFNDLDGKTFYRRIREQLGIPTNELVNIDELSPDQLSLGLFSAEELTDFGVLNYFGYDYLGNEFNGTFDDFFTLDPVTGERTFNVAPNRPIYSAAYLQDKFTINKMIFRLGVRVDRYDANTRVLKDPFTIFTPVGAGDFHRNAGTAAPGTIGEDFTVYTRSTEGEEVVGYRDGDQWYQADGSPANGSQEIPFIRSNLVFPVFARPEVYGESGGDFFKSDNFEVEDAFEDYEVQINVMPRLAFSFPISDEANFFAHYDVLVQRPPSNTIATALDYYYFIDRAQSRVTNNPNLRPERTVDYEVGFQQKLSASSAIKLSAYYKELRDMIQARTIFPVPFIGQYETFDNQDFGTTKGFSFSYDLRRTNNFQINANYTLQFADGTGSDANSQRGLTNRGNLRTLFPLNFDERHRINLIMDYRLPGNFQGFSLLRSLGANLQAVAVSGRPYTATFVPSEFGGSGTRGAINGARKPWNFTLNLRIDKQIKVADGIGLNVYFRVSNLLDRQNILNVYSVTGSPDDSGFLQSEFAQSTFQNFENSTRPLESYLASYQWRILNPDFFTLPRRMYIGAIMNF